MGDLIGMGSLEHKNFGALHPQFWRLELPLTWLNMLEGYTSYCTNDLGIFFHVSMSLRHLERLIITL